MNKLVSIRVIVCPVLVLISSISSVPSASGAVVEGWVRVYDGGSDGAGWVGIDGSGNVIVTGSSAEDFYTAKYAGISGALLWEKRQDGSARTTDLPYGMALDPSGNVAVTGKSSNQWYTAKYAAANGALLWEKRFGVWTPPENGYPRALAVDNLGNVIVTGVSTGDVYTAKFAASDGTRLWEKIFSTGVGHDQGNDVAVDNSGNVIVTGSANRSPSDTDYYTAKYAGANGALIWERRYNGPSNSYDFASAVALDAVGNVAVTGGSGGNFYTAKYAAANGALLWEKRYDRLDGGYSEAGRAVAVDRHGNVIVTGPSMNAFTNADFYTAKYAAADGALLWEKRFNGPGNGDDRPNAVVVDGDDNVVVTGYSEANADWSGADFYTAKYSAADGALLWEHRYNGTANQMDTSSRVAIGQNGMIVVVGSANITDSPDSGDFTTITYWEELSPLVINVTSGGVRLRLGGVPGRTYELQRAAGVTGPWSTITSVTASGNGPIEYVDSSPPVVSAFYRARTE